MDKFCPVPVSGTVPAEALPEFQSAVRYALAEKAAATRRAYRSDFDIFRAWCADKGLGALPAAPETVAAFLAHEAGRGVKTSTLGRRLAAIRYSHRLAGLASPSDAEPVKATLRGIKRTHGTARARKAPALPAQLKAMVALCPDSLTGKRDRALLLLGFAGAFRRSELVALDVADLEFVPEGVKVTVRRSKTDQEGAGRVLAIVRGIEACPVKALQDWLAAAGIKAGPIFRPIAKGGRLLDARLTDRSAGDLVKAYAARAGLDPQRFAGHSLRAGFLTASAAAGKNIFKMMGVSGHRSVETLRGYIRDASLFADHAGDGLL